MAARDVATLSWLVPLDTVVVSSESAESSAQVLEALLTNDEVNLQRRRYVVGAYNRPAHRRDRGVALGWSSLRHGDEVLRGVSSASREPGDATTYR